MSLVAPDGRTMQSMRIDLIEGPQVLLVKDGAVVPGVLDAFRGHLGPETATCDSWDEVWNLAETLVAHGIARDCYATWNGVPGFIRVSTYY